MATSTENTPNLVNADMTNVVTVSPAKTCTDCNIEKPADEFLNRNGYAKDNITRCSTCRLARRTSKSRRNGDLEKVARKVGLTVKPAEISLPVKSKTQLRKEKRATVIKFDRVANTTVLECQQCYMDLPASAFATDTQSENGVKNVCRYCTRYRNSPALAPSLEQFATMMVNSIAKQCLRCKIECTLTADDIICLLNKQANKCAVTGFDMTTMPKIASVNNFAARNVTVERLDETKGYTVDNVRLVCAIFTLMKTKMTTDEMSTFCQSVSRNK